MQSYGSFYLVLVFNFILQFTDKLNNWNAPFAKLIDLRTEIESIYDETKGNLGVDIFPVDGLPLDMKQVKKIYRQCSLYRRLLILAQSRVGMGNGWFHKYSKYILKPAITLVGAKYFCNKIEQIAHNIPYESAEYVGAVTWGLYGVGERMLKNEFEKGIEVDFEGYKMPAFSCWDSYLHGLYGDYMQLPPLEKRQTHNMTVYIKD